ncbi:hypothetical protein ACH5RR_031474 [Cinchona calisaya]|uniref:Isopenicillin N synthase-like Fe(2+) 2OG dioxygenase domain-containing protein n=1 Tax=Cinchona calisaya TaxID=153742 RepID=A0ABD2YIE1_9GENT
MSRCNNGTFDRIQMKRSVTWGDYVSCATDHLPADLQGLPGEFGSNWWSSSASPKSMGLCHPLPGALVVNLGDMQQPITNDRFKSKNHRVLAKDMGLRI